MQTPPKIAVLDDYQDVALSFADWATVQSKASVTVFTDHIAGEQAVIARLQPFQVICVMRERTPLTRAILTALPNLKLIVSTGTRNASIDVKAAEELGITLQHTGYNFHGAPELTWALIMAISKHIVPEAGSLRSGGWQHRVGGDLHSKTIGIVGLGNIGKDIARFAKAFDMNVVAWSENLTEEKAKEAGARLVSKEELFRISDYVTIHLVLSARSKGIVSAAELALMKPTAYLINTSRGPLVEEAALIQALTNNKIAGAALDVFDEEPLPANHPYRTLHNVLATPHIGYVTEDTYRIFYVDTVKALEAWLA